MNTEPEYLYKYRNFKDEFMKNIIINSSLYFSKVSNFNDPFDMDLDLEEGFSLSQRFARIKKLCKMHNLNHNEYKKMKKQARDHKFFLENEKNCLKISLDKVSILSLSSDPKNILMWSHYSDHHTGLVFEFKKNLTSSYLFQAIKVKYKNEYKPLSRSRDGSIKQKELQDLLVTKYSDWEYEKEYRIFDINNNPGEKIFDKSELTSIIFGLKTTEQNIQEIKTLCKENGFSHVKFKKAKRVYGKFELNIEDL